jgi:hypothetical protein
MEPEIAEAWNLIVTVCRKNVRGLSWEEFDIGLKNALATVGEKLFPNPDIPIGDDKPRRTKRTKAENINVDQPASNGEKADVPV